MLKGRYLYHGTSTGYLYRPQTGIMFHGLNPESSYLEHVCLTSRIIVAKHFAREKASADSEVLGTECHPVILRIRVDTLDPQSFVPDLNIVQFGMQLKDCVGALAKYAAWQTIFDEHGTVSYTKRIPAEAIVLKARYR